MSEITEYKDYVSQDLELSDEMLDEKWGVGVLVVNKKLDKMGEQLKQALIDAKTQSIEAANIDNDPKYKNASKEKKQAVAKKKEQLAKAKEQATQPIIDQMNTLCRETGIGKGANDPRCISHCRYVISKAQKEAISEILKKNEDILDKETKKALEELEKKREEQEKEGKEMEGKPADELKISKEDIDAMGMDEKTVKELYDEEKDGDKVFYRQKYKNTEDYVKSHDDLKGKTLVEVDEQYNLIDQKQKQNWPDNVFGVNFQLQFKSIKTIKWYGKHFLCVMPCYGLETIREKSAEIQKFFKEANKNNMFEKYEKLEGEEKSAIDNLFKYAMLVKAAAGTNEKDLNEDLDKESVEALFAEDGPFATDDTLKQLIGGDEGIEKIMSSKGGDEGESNEEIVEEYKKNEGKAVKFVNDKIVQIDKAVKQKKKMKDTFRGLVDFVKNLVEDKSKKLRDAVTQFWNSFHKKKKADDFDSLVGLMESEDFDDFEEVGHITPGVLKFNDWLLEKEKKDVKKEGKKEEDSKEMEESKELIKKLVKDYFDTIEDVTEEDKENLDKFMKEIDSPSDEDEEDSGKEDKDVNKEEVKDASSIIDDLGK